MIKFGAPRKGGGRIIGFGLSYQNLEKLLEGKLVAIDCAELGVPELTVYFLAGETEEAMQAELEKSGIQIPKPKMTEVN